ncbi:hypothetical protein [Thiomonas intermedia]|nr:hypothetical protein [Thiomonas intermedia]
MAGKREEDRVGIIRSGARDQLVWPDVDLQLLDVGGKRVFGHRDGRLY